MRQGHEQPGRKPDKLIVDTFGEFGYDDLVKQYEQHTGIKVELRKTAQLGDYRPKLVRYLATGKGAGDVVALEEGIINEFKINPANWVDLKPLVGDLSAEYLPWKYELGKAADGKLHRPADRRGQPRGLLPPRPVPGGRPAGRPRRGLGAVADVGRVHRDRPEVPRRDRQGHARLGDHRVPARSCSRSAATSSTTRTTTCYAGRRQRHLVAAKSPAVKQAWDTSVKLVDANITAKTATWSPEWSAGFKNGTFAATFCPSWMIGIVQANSGAENTGKWDVAAVPGGGGNWGGSWLSVPTQSKYPSRGGQAGRVPDQRQSQVAAFKVKGPLPTNLTALKNPDFQAYTNAVLQQRPDRQDLRRQRRRHQAARPRPEARRPSRSRRSSRRCRPTRQGSSTADAAWKQFLNDVPIQGAY